VTSVSTTPHKPDNSEYVSVTAQHAPIAHSLGTSMRTSLILPAASSTHASVMTFVINVWYVPRKPRSTRALFSP
jgi:hypothetical protein